MSAGAWALAGGAAAMAAVAAVADGALLAALPGSEESSATDPVGDARYRDAAARERAHRALAFLRVAGHGIAGGAVAAALLPGAQGGLAWIGTVALLGLLLVGLAETAARALGDALGETAVARLAGVTRAAEWVCAPIVALGGWLDGLFAAVVAPAGQGPDPREETAEQFRQVVESEPRVSTVAREMLLGVFDFGETSVGDVMVPRVDIVAIPRELPWADVIAKVRSAHHSRLPVYTDSVDDIVGILYAKDLLPAHLAGEEPAGGWTRLVRPAAYIPASKRIADQLREFKGTRTHIAIVVDEYGGTEGLVTIEDILEELVGEIRDEYDDEERPVEQEDGVRWWVSGRMTLDDLSDLVGHDFGHEEVSTIGGLVYELLGRVPRAGEQLDVHGYRVIVERVVRRKVARVYIERTAAATGADDDGPDA